MRASKEIVSFIIVVIIYAWFLSVVFSQDIPKFIYKDDSVAVNGIQLQFEGELWLQSIEDEIKQRDKISDLNKIDSLRSSQNAKFRRLFEEYEKYSSEQKELINEQNIALKELFLEYKESEKKIRRQQTIISGGVAILAGFVLLK